MGYGGNTPCLEVRGPGSDVFIFDGGTGLRQLGSALEEEFKDHKLHIRFFLTHCHWDHIQGIPFFAPLYEAQHEVTFYSPASCPNLQKALEGQMRSPYFPVEFKSAAIRRHFVEPSSGPVKCDGLTISAFPVHHPQGAVAYRIESSGASAVYATDVETGNARLDSVLRDYAQNADILIHDAQYTPEEYQRHKGWGHSTWEQAAQAARDVKARQLVLFHHDPWHSDESVSTILENTRRRVDGAVAAREHLILTL